MNNRRALLTTLAFLALLKSAFLATLGPVTLPDSSDYVLFAEAILAGGDWARDLDLSAELIPLTAVRAVGYPALMALFKLGFGNAWEWGLIVFQMGVSLGASAMLWRLAVALSGRTWVAVTSVLAHGLGLAFVLDQCLLTDSLHASLIIGIAAHAGRALVIGRALTLREALALGGGLLLAFLLREAGAIMHLALWPLVLAWAWKTATGSGTARVGRALLMLAVFLIPLLTGIQAYKAWNQMRTGERFITTVAQTAMYHPVVDLARNGYPVFAEDPLLAEAPFTRVALNDNPGVVFSQINQYLKTVQGMNALAVARHADKLFAEHWQRYPMARGGIYLSRLDPRYAYLPVMPLAGPERLSLWAGGTTPFPGPGKIWDNLVDHGRIDQVALLAVRTLARLGSALLTALFLAGVPVVVLKGVKAAGGRPDELSGRDLAMGALWLFVAAYPAAYALVYLEDRYLAPVVPFVTIGGLALVARLIGERQATRGRSVG
ncbi:MAG: hypothetical protein CMM61_11840 [Rhodospirillaceae bacterium]|nr:hypothetical protein [Rhodospirillaceae bacterium]